ncbi:MAG: glycine--tRNA ligase subunit beta [bacterium]
MVKYVFELGLEEVPARFCRSLTTLVDERIRQSLSDARLSFDGVSVMMTYRRLVICIDGLAESQTDISQQVMGPPCQVAYDAEGQLTAAGQGFLRKIGVDISQVQTKQDAKGRDVLFVEKSELGSPTSQCLGALIQTLVENLPLSIAMRWGQGQGPFVRPVQWVLSLLNDQLLPITLFGVTADLYTFGHRFLSEDRSDHWLGLRISVRSAETFIQQLQDEGQVILDPTQRKQVICDALPDGAMFVDDTLLEELVYLSECPGVLRAKITDDFLTLPHVVVETCLTKHQKYIPLKDADGRLTGDYVLVSDNLTADNDATIRQGNERVLVARLRDAQFFWEQDQKVGLMAYAQRLEGLVYQAGLGSMADKQRRLLAISRQLAEAYFSCDTASLEALCACSKADLMSLMVQEFPSLQGYMAEAYARLEGAPELLCVALREQYEPRTASGTLPQSDLGVMLAMADRLDHCVAAFILEQNPSGSRDPLGIRRSVVALLRIALDRDLDVNFSELFRCVYEVYGKESLYAAHAEVIETFVLQRIQSQFEALGLAYDVVAAVLPLSYVSLVTAYRRALDLADFKAKDVSGYKAFVETGLRVRRLLQKQDSFVLDEGLFEMDIERDAYLGLQNCVTQEVLSLQALTPFVTVMTRYFEDVLVMHDKRDIQQNRLAFLQQCHAVFATWGDLETLVL